VRNHRLMFEIHDRIYVVALDEYNRIQDIDHPLRASYSLPACSTPQLAVPISFMALYEDAIMTTYTVSTASLVGRISLRLVAADTWPTTTTSVSSGRHGFPA
jgi:hypothetical protein